MAMDGEVAAVVDGEGEDLKEEDGEIRGVGADKGEGRSRRRST